MTEPHDPRSPWRPFREGQTIGERGSEDGVIVQDDEHVEGARITLEHDGVIAPWSITCGVYGLLVHTRFFDTQEAAEVALADMKVGLDDVLRELDVDDLEQQGRLAQRFVAKFP
jgi:hypothetical protein